VRSAFTEKLNNELEYGVISLDFDPKNAKNDETYFFITKGCAAIVNKNGKHKVVTQGHSDG
jgi:hypothetical protein